MNKMKTNKGYIALLSTIIISSILLYVVLQSSYAGYFSRFNILRSENKEQSYELAQSCLQIALVRLAENPNYKPPSSGDSFPIDQSSCKILSVISDGQGILTIRTTSNINRANSNIEASVASNGILISINSIKEVSNF